MQASATGHQKTLKTLVACATPSRIDTDVLTRHDDHQHAATDVETKPAPDAAISIVVLGNTKTTFDWPLKSGKHLITDKDLSLKTGLDSHAGALTGFRLVNISFACWRFAPVSWRVFSIMCY